MGKVWKNDRVIREISKMSVIKEKNGRENDKMRVVVGKRVVETVEKFGDSGGRWQPTGECPQGVEKTIHKRTGRGGRQNSGFWGKLGRLSTDFSTGVEKLLVFHPADPGQRYFFDPSHRRRL